MKKSWYLLPIALLVVSGMAGAQQAPQQPQKQAQPSAKPVTSVKAAMGAADERRVQLKGKIVSHQGKNVYLFQDATGKIPLVIGGKAVQPGQKLGPGVPVHVTGHVDRDKGSPRIMVSSARVVVGDKAGKGDD